MKIVTLPENRTPEGFANLTKCKCKRPKCDDMLALNGHDKAVETEAGYIQLSCAVRLGLITREQALKA